MRVGSIEIGQGFLVKSHPAVMVRSGLAVEIRSCQSPRASTSIGRRPAIRSGLASKLLQSLRNIFLSCNGIFHGFQGCRMASHVLGLDQIWNPDGQTRMTNTTRTKTHFFFCWSGPHRVVVPNGQHLQLGLGFTDAYHPTNLTSF